MEYILRVIDVSLIISKIFIVLFLFLVRSLFNHWNNVVRRQMRRRQISRRLHSGRQISRLDPTKHEKLKSSSLSVRIKYILNPILYNKTELLLMQSILRFFFQQLKSLLKTLIIFERDFQSCSLLHSITKKISFY